MKIQNSPQIQQVMKAYGKTAGKVKKTAGPKMEKDKIEISDKARDFQVAMQAAKGTSEVRAAKVKEIKEQIANGTYKPSAEDVADKILGRIRDLGE